MSNRNFVRSVLAEGGEIKQLMIASTDSGGLGLCNPSVFVDRDELWMILRNVNYTLYHAENGQTFNNRFGPLAYLNPENDLHLRTTNFLCKLAPSLEIERYWKIDTSMLDKEPLWEFVGLEDARLVRWDGHLYAIGCRRDTTTNGQSRMEFSELEVTDKSVKEIGRYRIEHPTNPEWYCEKNWMPVLDMPYHFIQWTNPAVLVKADLTTLKSCRVREVDEADKIEGMPFLRGNSQVIHWKDYYVCVVHDCDLFKNNIGQKDATYMHRFVVYDQNWKIVRIGEPFSFLDGEIEFCCGLTEWQNDLLITFGFQDNCAFILRVPERAIPKVLGLNETSQQPRVKNKWHTTSYPTLEITTAIPKNGCPPHCAFCPQDKLVAVYNGERILSLPDYVKLIDKVPPEIQITFAGFAEPFLNPNCAAMICHAHATGHKVSLFTTGMGMSLADFEQIKGIPFTGVQGGFVLHLPDVEGYFSHHSDKYTQLLTAIKRESRHIENFRSMTMGTLSPALRGLFPETIRPAMYNRAGNVKKTEFIQISLNTTEMRNSDTTCGCPERLYHSVLLPNGDVSLCCMDYGLEHILGNLYKHSFEEIVPKDGTPFVLCKTCENGVPA